MDMEVEERRPAVGPGLPQRMDHYRREAERRLHEVTPGSAGSLYEILLWAPVAIEAYDAHDRDALVESLERVFRSAATAGIAPAPAG